MENGLKHVLERKGWIKDEPEMTDKNEYKVYTRCILPLDTVNRNNRKFSKEVVQKAIDKLKGQPVPCRLNMPRWNIRNKCLRLICRIYRDWPTFPSRTTA